MNVLCIETSAHTGSVALLHGGQLRESNLEPRRHAEQIVAKIESLLRDAGVPLAGLDAIAFGCGPGSFIGVRLGAAVAQGLGTGAGVGLAPVCSMAALALRAAADAGAREEPGAEASQDILVCLDARMDEVYSAHFRWRDGRIETLAPPRLHAPADIDWPAAGRWLAAGGGFASYAALSVQAERRGARVRANVQPRATELAPFAADMIANEALVAADAWQVEYLRTERAWRRLS